MIFVKIKESLLTIHDIKSLHPTRYKRSNPSITVVYKDNSSTILYFPDERSRDEEYKKVLDKFSEYGMVYGG